MGAVSHGPWARLLARAGLVAAGGAVGTALRAALENAAPAAPGGWPWTTFGINLLGSFVLGALLEVVLRTGQDEGWRRRVRLGCGTGVLGGFTTYSTFVVEVERLLTGGHPGIGLAYALVSVVVGIVCALLGITMVRSLPRGQKEEGA